APRIRRPHRKRRAANAIDRAAMRPKRLPQFEMIALGDQIRVDIAENRPEPIRIVDNAWPFRSLDLKHVIERLPFARHPQFEETVVIETRELAEFRAVA